MGLLVNDPALTNKKLMKTCGFLSISLFIQGFLEAAVWQKLFP